MSAPGPHAHNDTLMYHRREQRSRGSSAVFWREPGDIVPAMGWLLDNAPSGMAFAHRGKPPPKPGDKIDVQRHITKGQGVWERAVVRRAKTAHADLSVIAVEFLRPEVNHQAAEAVAELKAWQNAPTRNLQDLVPDPQKAA